MSESSMSVQDALTYFGWALIGLSVLFYFLGRYAAKDPFLVAGCMLLVCGNLVYAFAVYDLSAQEHGAEPSQKNLSFIMLYLVLAGFSARALIAQLARYRREGCCSAEDSDEDECEEGEEGEAGEEGTQPNEAGAAAGAGLGGKARGKKGAGCGALPALKDVGAIAAGAAGAAAGGAGGDAAGLRRRGKHESRK